MTFADSAGPYFVDVDEQNQDQILVTYKSGPLPWEVLRKRVSMAYFASKAPPGGTVTRMLMAETGSR